MQEVHYILQGEKKKKMDDDDIPTSTPFSALVREGEPFCWSELAAQDVHSSLRITHVSYLPPTSMEELKEYYKAHPEAPRPVRVQGKTIPHAFPNHGTHSSNSTSNSSYQMTYAVAEVEDFSVGGEMRRMVIGCFPLDLRRLPPSEPEPSTTPSTTTLSSALSANKERSEENFLSFQHGLQILVPVDSDVMRNIRIQLDCDGSVKLHMRGPGQLFFYGEQRSLLLPEWKNHHFFAVNPDDEEREEESEDMNDEELVEMFRLAR